MLIKDTFDFYNSLFERKKLFILFPNLKEELLNQYNQIINNFDKQYSGIDLFQEYFQTINTGIRDDYYIISWSIGKIDNIVSKNNLSVKDLNLEKIFSDEENLNLQKSVSFINYNIEDFKPIYVSYYLPLECYIVVDGNHRVKELKKREYRKTKGYVLLPYCNIETMNEFSFSLYKFHHNLVALHRLCIDPYLWSFKTNKSLQKNSFFSENIEFKYVIFKKLILLLS